MGQESIELGWYVRRGVRSEGEDCSIGGHLMRVRDTAGQPLPYVRLWSELSIFFYAGVRLGPSNDLP